MGRSCPPPIIRSLVLFSSEGGCYGWQTNPRLMCSRAEHGRACLQNRGHRYHQQRWTCIVAKKSTTVDTFPHDLRMWCTLGESPSVRYPLIAYIRLPIPRLKSIDSTFTLISTPVTSGFSGAGGMFSGSNKGILSRECIERHQHLEKNAGEEGQRSDFNSKRDPGSNVASSKVRKTDTLV